MQGAERLGVVGTEAGFWSGRLAILLPGFGHRTASAVSGLARWLSRTRVLVRGSRQALVQFQITDAHGLAALSYAFGDFVVTQVTNP